MTTDTNQLEGDALDAALAKALGLVPCRHRWRIWKGAADGPVTKRGCPHGAGECYPEGQPPLFSADDDAAIALATELQRRGYLVEITMYPDEGGAACYISDLAGKWRRAECDTLPEAVAVAALAALGEGDDDTD